MEKEKKKEKGAREKMMDNRINKSKTKKQKNYSNFLQRTIKRRFGVDKTGKAPIFNSFCCIPNETSLYPKDAKKIVGRTVTRKITFDWKKFVKKHGKKLNVCNNIVYFFKENELNKLIEKEGFFWDCGQKNSSYILVPDVEQLQLFK